MRRSRTQGLGASRPRALLLASLALCLPVTACSSDDSSSGQPSPSPTGSAASRAQVEADVMDAWRAEHEAYVSAVIKMDPNDAGLQQTATNPLLNQAKGFIAAAKHTGAY